jgi:hypothetical protein
MKLLTELANLEELQELFVNMGVCRDVYAVDIMLEQQFFQGLLFFLTALFELYSNAITRKVYNCAFPGLRIFDMHAFRKDRPLFERVRNLDKDQIMFLVGDRQEFSRVSGYLITEKERDTVLPHDGVEKLERLILIALFIAIIFVLGE